MTDNQPSGGFRARTLEFEAEMSPGEALMWRVASDPWLDPSGSLVAPLDQPVDLGVFRDKISHGVAQIPRLAERVVESSHPTGSPRWEIDPEFDLNNHIIEVDVAAPGDRTALLALATQIHTTPLPPDRPPWAIYSVRGLGNGNGALISRLHHSIADGIGALRMSEVYIDLERNPHRQSPVDLRELLRTRAAAAPPVADSTTSAILEALAAPLGALKAAAAEVALIGADPDRIRERIDTLTDSLRAAMSQLSGNHAADSCSRVWAKRSGARVLVTAQKSLDTVKAAAKQRNVTVNDLFVTAMANAGAAYLSENGEEPDFLSMSYVRSTRTGTGVGGNAFSPIRVTAPVADTSHDERLAALHHAMAPSESGEAISLDRLSAVAGFLPTAVVTRLGRDQGRRIDIVTSNIRGAPLPLFIGGAAVEATYAIGPIAGAACNATLMSYNGSLDIGIMVDPMAITDPPRLAELVQAALDELAVLH